MTRIDPTTLDHDHLFDLLREWAAGYRPDEAALALLRHGCDGFWLRRRDFLTACVDVAVDGWTTAGPDGTDHLEATVAPSAAVRWEDVPRFLARGVPASTGEVNLLRAAASLMGAQVGSLREITTGMDADTLALILDAVAHRAGWHEHAITRTVTGHLDRAAVVAVPAP